MRPFPLSLSDLARVLLPFDEAVSLPPLAYHDDAVFERERAAIFDQAWLCVGREDDVSSPGQWCTAPVPSDDLVLVRGEDLVLRAFHNVCRHRAAPLFGAVCGRAQAIRCPYHGWTYELSGSLRHAPDTRDDFDRAAHGLAEVRVDTWQGFVFVARRPDLPALEAWLLGMPSWLRDTDLSQVTRAHGTDYEVNANWKLLAENFQESHHFTRIHPALERLTPNDAARSVLRAGPWLGGTMSFADGVETVSESGTRNGRPFLAASPYRRQVSDALLFPTLFTSLQPDYLLTYRLVPLAPDRTRIFADIYVHPAAANAPHGHADLVAFWDRVNGEDRAICERQQLGIRSRGYQATHYSTVEDGVHAFDRRVAEAYLT